MNINFKLAIALAQVLQGHYEGGLREFTESGGQISVMPDASNLRVYLYHPNGFPQNIHDLLEQHNTSSSDFQIFVCSTINFEGVSPEEFVEALNKSLNPLLQEKLIQCSVFFNPVGIVFSIHDRKIHDEDTETLFNLIKDVEGICRFSIVCPDGSMFSDTSPSQIKIERQELDRDTIIQPDEITNLQIQLGQKMDVNDFINGL